MANLIDELEREVAHSDFMAGMAHHWMRRAQDAERTLAIVVRAAGGKVIVQHGDLVEAMKLELIKFYQDYDMTMHFIAREVTTKENPQGA